MVDPEFDRERLDHLAALGGDAELQRRGMELVRDAGRHGWSYTWDWLGLPIIQHPSDVVGLQEVLWRVRPAVVIETGVARGGSLVLSASVLELIGGDGVVLGVEIDLRPRTRAALDSHPMRRRIETIDGSSVDPAVVGAVQAFAAERQPVMVILDSMHTHGHVLRELELYAPLVTLGSYLVVFDTAIAHMPADYFPDRPWGPGDNPSTAVDAFLAANDEFEIDRELEAKLLSTAAPGGWLRRRMSAP